MWTGLLASVLFLIVISVERYHAVVNPLGHQTGIIASRLRTIVAACWLSALAWNIPIIVLMRYNITAGVCLVKWGNNNLARARSVWWVAVTAAVPIGIMGFLYIRIIRCLRGTVIPENFRRDVYISARYVHTSNA